MTPARLLSSPAETTTGTVLGTGLDHLEDKARTRKTASVENGPGGEEMAALTHAPSEERNQPPETDFPSTPD